MMVPGKRRRNRRTGTNFSPIPLQDTKVQRKYQKKKQNTENFYWKKLHSVFMTKTPYFAPPRAPTTQGAHSAASWKERIMKIYSEEDAQKKPAQWAHRN